MNRRWATKINSPALQTYHDALHLFYVHIWVGTPPQRQTVLVDTGRGVTAFPCQGCLNCGNHTDPCFQQELSTTYHKVSCKSCLFAKCSFDAGTCAVSTFHCYLDTCEIDLFYGSGVRRGFEASDTFHAFSPEDEIALAITNDAFTAHFACDTSLAGKLFHTDTANGIMGMDMTNTSFWKQMFDAGSIGKKQFSFCVAPSPTTAIDGNNSSDGVLTLGGTDTRLHETEMIYAALHRANISNYLELYCVTITNIVLRSGGGDSIVSTSDNATTLRIDASPELLNDPAGAIIDSGSNFIILALH